MKRENNVVKELNDLVKGELAAVETYREALDKISGPAAGEDLRAIESDHEEALIILRDAMTQLHAAAPVDSGLWGEWSKAVEGAAAAFGDKAAIKALKEGEEHGVMSYERALRDQALDPALSQVIRSRLLPRTRAHVGMLDRLLVESPE